MSHNLANQWIVRYRNHKTRKCNFGWIEDIMWDKKAANLAVAHAKLHWKEVEMVPFIDKNKRSRFEREERNERHERNSRNDFWQEQYE